MVAGVLANLSPGNAIDAESYLAAVTGGEVLVHGGVLLTWPDGMGWTFAARERPYRFDDRAGVSAYTEPDMEEREEQAGQEERDDVLKQAMDQIQKVVATALAKAQERLQAKTPRWPLVGRPPRRLKWKKHNLRRLLPRPEAVQLDDYELEQVANAAIEAEWTLE